MNSFGRKKLETHTQLVVNITSRGVGGALVYENDVGQHVIWHRSVPFSSRLAEDKKARRQTLARALADLLDGFSRTGRRRLMAFKERATLSQVAVFFSAPWGIDDAVTASDKEQKAMPFTQERLRMLRKQAHRDFENEHNFREDNKELVDLSERVVGAYGDGQPIVLPLEDFKKEAAVTFHIGKVYVDIFDTINRQISTHFSPEMTTIHSYNDIILDGLRKRSRRKKQLFVRVHDHQVDVYIIRGDRVITSASAPVGETFLHDALHAAGIKEPTGAEDYLRLARRKKQSGREQRRFEIATEEVRGAFVELLVSAVENSGSVESGITHVHILTTGSPAGELFGEFAKSAAGPNSFEVYSLNDAGQDLRGVGEENSALDPELALGILGYKLSNK